jgi:hypothetical protein
LAAIPNDGSALRHAAESLTQIDDKFLGAVVASNGLFVTLMDGKFLGAVVAPNGLVGSPMDCKFLEAVLAPNGLVVSPCESVLAAFSNDGSALRHAAERRTIACQS